MEVSTEKRIGNAFNKFRYDMTVEWNQQDAYFKEYAQTEFENSLLALRAEGVTVEDIQTYMEKSILDAKTKNDYRRLVASMKKQDISEDEASVVAMNFMEKNYSQSASFSSGSSANYKKIAIIVGVVIIGVVTFLIIRNCKKNDSTTTSSSSSTSTTGVGTTSTTSVTSSSTSSSSTGGTNGNNGNSGNVNGNNGWGNGDQNSPGNSCAHNNAENSGCLSGVGSAPGIDSYPGNSSHTGSNGSNGNNGNN